MMQVNLADASTQLANLFQMVQTGREKEIIFTQDDRPFIRMERCQDEYDDLTPEEIERRTSLKDGVRIGIAEGKLVYPDDIHAFDDEIAELFGVAS